MGVREKGSSFERKVAERFSDKFGTKFRRTPLSGGFDKSMIQGDIFTDNKKFSLIVECKNHKTFSVPQWWKQVRDDTPRFKIPLLIMYFSGMYHKNKSYSFKKNQTDILVLLRLRDYRKIMRPTNIGDINNDVSFYIDSKLSMPKYINDLVNSGQKYVHITSPVLTGNSDEYILLTLDTFFESIYVKRCFKRIIAIKKSQN